MDNLQVGILLVIKRLLPLRLTHRFRKVNNFKFHRSFVAPRTQTLRMSDHFISQSLSFTTYNWFDLVGETTPNLVLWKVVHRSNLKSEVKTISNSVVKRVKIAILQSHWHRQPSRAVVRNPRCRRYFYAGAHST